MKNKYGFRIGNTPRCVTFRTDSLDGVWKEILRKAQEAESKEFSGASLGSHRRAIWFDLELC